MSALAALLVSGPYNLCCCSLLNAQHALKTVRGQQMGADALQWLAAMQNVPSSYTRMLSDAHAGTVR